MEPTHADSHRRMPRWAWPLIALLALIAVVAIAVAAVSVRGGQVQRVAPPPPAPSPAPATSTAQATSSSTPTRADGCLGGPTELDQAVVTAQAQAPLTQEGAASFAATAIRWAMVVPAPPFQAQTSQRILAKDATAAARNLSGTKPADDTTLTPSTAEARYYVESYDTTKAIVSVTAQITGTRAGAPQGQADVAGSLTLVAINGTWHLQDITESRSVADLQRIGTVYAGGC